jgi:hypothetical protein
MRMKKPGIAVAFAIILSPMILFSQPVPAEDENIPYLVTFGADADVSWGDDDFCQIFFFVVPSAYTNPLYLRIFDPDTGGKLDEMKGSFNTIVRFSVFGGNGAWSEEDARKDNPEGNFNSGNILASNTFGQEDRYDDSWFTFGPFIQQEGEFTEKLGGYVFKMITQGIQGDDGNLYRFFMSTSAHSNEPVEGGNIFTYEYTFRLADDPGNVSQIYPFLDDQVTSVKIQNYDWDNDGSIRLVSVAKRGERCLISGEREWKENTFLIEDIEKNTSMELQFIKDPDKRIRNNNVVVIVQNQYGESLPFFVIPIGGRPVYNPMLKMKPVPSK